MRDKPCLEDHACLRPIIDCLKNGCVALFLDDETFFESFGKKVPLLCFNTLLLS